MFDRLHGRMRTVLAMCCMALTTVLAAQGAITTVDQAQHALNIDHAPTAMAGAVHYDHDDHHAGAHLPVVADSDLTADGEPGQPGHHHATEGPQLATLSVARLAEVVLVKAAMPPTPRSDGAVLLVGTRLERPPKPISKTIA
ncbi:MAG: hypothetical protein V4820_11150 [Pseudomonadota bacterium]